jgi:hypothetical protein
MKDTEKLALISKALKDISNMYAPEGMTHLATETLKKAGIIASRVSFLVSFDLPPNATLTDAGNYVRDAMDTHWESCKPTPDDSDEDPMYQLDNTSIKVTVW